MRHSTIAKVRGTPISLNAHTPTVSQTECVDFLVAHGAKPAHTFIEQQRKRADEVLGDQVRQLLAEHPGGIPIVHLRFHYRSKFGRHLPWTDSPEEFEDLVRSFTGVQLTGQGKSQMVMLASEAKETATATPVATATPAQKPAAPPAQQPPQPPAWSQGSAPVAKKAATPGIPATSPSPDSPTPAQGSPKTTTIAASATPAEPPKKVEQPKTEPQPAPLPASAGTEPAKPSTSPPSPAPAPAPDPVPAPAPAPALAEAQQTQAPAPQLFGASQSNCKAFLEIFRGCSRVAIQAIRAAKSIGIVMLWLQSPRGGLWVFDIASATEPDRQAVGSALGEAFECIQVTKVMHGSTEQLELLRRDLGVTAVNSVADTLALEAVIRGEKDAPKNHTVSDLLERHGVPTASEQDFTLIDAAAWERRPISQELVKAAVGHLFSLFLLHTAQERAIATSAAVASILKKPHPGASSSRLQPPPQLLDKDVFLSFNECGSPTYSVAPADGASPVGHGASDEAFASLLPLLPESLRKSAALQHVHAREAAEVVLELGRKPYILLDDCKAVPLSENPTDRASLAEATAILRRALELPEPSKDGSGGDPFDATSSPSFKGGRLWIEGTLHSITPERHSDGQLVGLVYRIGRQFVGCVDIIQDLLRGLCGDEPRAALVIGRAGAGATSMLRDAARFLSEVAARRVAVVDTVGDIAGGGHCPDPAAAGHCRRLLARDSDDQWKAISEAVALHSPQVLVVDSVETEKDFEAIRQAIRRGVSVVCGARVCDTRAILSAPELCTAMGVEKVAQEAQSECPGVPQQQRRSSPLFDFIIEVSWHGRVVVLRPAAAAIDGVIKGRPVVSEARWFDRGTLSMKARFSETILGKF